MGGAPVHQPNEPTSSENRLDSWKDVAAYLKRSVPTVQRWEKDEGLPVHRHIHKKQGSVYAYKSELDEWWNRRQGTIESKEAVESVPEAAVQEAAPRRWRPGIVVGAAVVLLALTAAILFWKARPRPIAGGDRVMIAVLPFQNLGGGPQLEYVCDGLTEEVITELAALDPNQLGIIARTSAMVYKGKGVGVRDIGRELGVEYVVEGSVLFAEKQSRVTVQLIRVSDQSHLWAHTYDGKAEDLLEVEQEISRAVAEEVNVRVASSRPRPSTRRSSDPEAYRLYVQGRQLWEKRSREDLERSVDLLERSTKKDPKFAPAHAALADSYNQLGYFGYRPIGLTIPKAQQAAQRALELDPQSAGANAALGFINAMWLWDWKEAEARYQRAIALDPGYVPGHQYYALFLASAGRLKQAAEEMAIAQRLDPLEPSVNSGSAYVLYLAHDYEKSIGYCRRAIERDDQYAVAHALLGWDDVQLKRYPEAIVELKRALALAPENSLYLATLGRAEVLAGQNAEADHVLQQLDEVGKHKWVGASTKAIIYTAKNDREQALRSLEDAQKQEDWFMLWLKVTPEFDPLRDDVRFQKLVERAGLPSGIQ